MLKKGIWNAAHDIYPRWKKKKNQILLKLEPKEFRKILNKKVSTYMQHIYSYLLERDWISQGS